MNRSWKQAAVSYMLLLVMLILTACSSGGPLSESSATEIAENALVALSDGDYKAYTRDFGFMMKSVVTEEVFTSLHQEASQNLGKFVSIDKVEKMPAETEGFDRWEFTCTFEKSKMRLALVFKQDGDKVEGLHFDEAN